ncbi:hypothetical protein [Seleniivibrio woodruffii]|uniref:hypothetical protein n=1 Tax=Seleniivibrio woodruffii TaxID=1078050 RepID=UPI0024093FAC|nr:hypothetical protein [Seleniivibrio woodruffii]
MRNIQSLELSALDNIINEFYKMWGNFPLPVVLVSGEHRVVARNKAKDDSLLNDNVPEYNGGCCMFIKFDKLNKMNEIVIYTDVLMSSIKS